jgi:hypothetical protein
VRRCGRLRAAFPAVARTNFAKFSAITKSPSRKSFAAFHFRRTGKEPEMSDILEIPGFIARLTAVEKMKPMEFS